MSRTLAIHQWDNGNGESGICLLAASGGGNFRVVPFDDPDAPNMLAGLSMNKLNPMYGALERQVKAAQATRVFSHLPAAVQAAIEAA